MSQLIVLAPAAAALVIALLVLLVVLRVRARRAAAPTVAPSEAEAEPIDEPVDDVVVRALRLQIRVLEQALEEQDRPAPETVAPVLPEQPEEDLHARQVDLVTRAVMAVGDVDPERLDARIAAVVASLDRGIDGRLIRPALAGRAAPVLRAAPPMVELELPEVPVVTVVTEPDEPVAIPEGDERVVPVPPPASPAVPPVRRRSRRWVA